LLGLAGGAAVTLLTELLPVGVLPQMSSALHVPAARIGLLAGGYAAAATVAAVPLTALTRPLGRRPLLTGLLAGLALANLVTALSASYPLTLAVRILAGLANGVLWSMFASYAAGIVTARQRGRAVAITLAGITVTLSAGVPAATALAGRIGWRATFAVAAVAAAGMACYAAAGLPPLAGAPAGGRGGLVTVLRRPGIRAVLATTGLLLAGHQAMYTYLAPLSGTLGLGSTSLVLLTFGGCAMAGIIAAGAAIDAHPRPVVLSAVALIAGAALALALGARHAAAFAATGAWGLGFGAAPTAIQAALIRAAGQELGEIATALQTTTYNAAIAAGALLGGAALSRGGVAALPWTALPLAAAALVLAAAARRHAFPVGAPAASAGPPGPGSLPRHELSGGGR
jgi:predicted MFS family arabinose efflux permease